VDEYQVAARRIVEILGEPATRSTGEPTGMREHDRGTGWHVALEVLIEADRCHHEEDAVDDLPAVAVERARGNPVAGHDRPPSAPYCKRLNDHLR
jgi:hypothetical protein